MYQKVSTDLKFVDREKKTEKFWAENHIFEKSLENRKEGETYTFYDGPPTANGKPLQHTTIEAIPRIIEIRPIAVPFSSATGSTTSSFKTTVSSVKFVSKFSIPTPSPFIFL